ncbi:MAG: glutathione S-transferase N-terminal domain-containing protein [Myxococcales bacterium]|nr:glutathione S-transferase N-terminal domain-containing protein [Myxococcales bacterium]
MIIDNPVSPLPAKLRGLHLFHDGVATCAQRVRFVLAEKGLARGPDVAWDSDAVENVAPPDARSYVSRPVSIRKKQHLTAAYAAIQPNMVVPALVHDGVLHIESVDIIDYLERTWPEPALVPRDAEGAAACRELVARAKGLHRSIRFILFRWALPGSTGKLSPEERDALRELEREDSPEQLAAFYESYSTDAFTDDVFVKHLRDLEAGFAEVDTLLSDGRAWLLGDDFSMADVMWSLKMMRLWEIRYPFDSHYPALGAWYERVTSRPGFREAVWRDARAMSLFVRTWARACHAFGGGVGKVARPLLSTPQ